MSAFAPDPERLDFQKFVDPVCAFHGMRWSEHVCMYCCLCFKDLSWDDSNVLADGTREDVCRECAEMESQIKTSELQAKESV
jgi:hypothetical protein